jgi:hypothetical protein
MGNAVGAELDVLIFDNLVSEKIAQGVIFVVKRESSVFKVALHGEIFLKFWSAILNIGCHIGVSHYYLKD